MNPARRSALAIAATLGPVAIAPVVQAAPSSLVGDPSPTDGARTGSSGTAATTAPDASADVPCGPAPTSTPASTTSTSTTSTTTTTTIPTTTTPSTIAPESGEPHAEGAAAATGAVASSVANPVAGSAPPQACQPEVTTTTAVPPAPSTSVPVVPTIAEPAAPVGTEAVAAPPAINAPATPNEPVVERQPAAPGEAIEPELPSQTAAGTPAAIDAVTPEPTAPLPPTNPTWTSAGVPRLVAPRVPGTGSLQLGRTPAGERVVLVDDVEVILATIRQLESAGRYDIGPNRARASGAYQYIPSTWNNYGGYAEAYLAPPAVQDERARADVLRFLSMYGGDVSMVPIMWYYPRAAQDRSWMDRIPNPAGGNRLTIRQYQTRWLEQLAANATVLLGTYVPAPSTPAAVSVLSEIPEHEIPVDEVPVDAVPADETSVTVPVSPVPAPTVPAPIASVTPDAPVETTPPVVIDVDVVTVSESTIDLAARSVPPANDEEDGLGSMRTIVFPVLGPVAYANGWGDPRAGGRAHEGTDIVGVRMQPILAVVDGVVSRYQPTSTGIRGVAISIADVDGWRYNYFHNNDDTPGTDDGQAVDEFRLAPGLELGDTVVAGQIIGYMGDSGNAEESVAHLHFELRDPTGRARPSYWSLRSAEARQACTIGIGPWSTPTVGQDAAAEAPADATVAATGAVAAPVADPPVAGVVPQAAALDQPIDRPGLASDTTTEPGATVEPLEPIVEHTVVTPMYGEGQWVIDSEGRVTATGDAALIMPRRDLQCDVGPATPFGTESAGWSEVDHGVLDGTVLQDADLTGTVLADVVPEPPAPVITELLPLAARFTGKTPNSAAGPFVDDAPATLESILAAPPGGALLVDGNDVTFDGESVIDDPISQPMAFTDPATGETIIVVFELPPPRPDLITTSGIR